MIPPAIAASGILLARCPLSSPGAIGPAYHTAAPVANRSGDRDYTEHRTRRRAAWVGGELRHRPGTDGKARLGRNQHRASARREKLVAVLEQEHRAGPGL